MGIDLKILKALILCIVASFLIISCSDSGTNTSTPPEETGPPAPLTGFDNYQQVENTSVTVTFVNGMRDNQVRTRIDVYLPGDPEFEFSINDELISFERDTIYDSGPTDGVHYFLFDKSIPFGETLDLELVYEDETYSHTLMMPYSPEIQIPDSLNVSKDLELTWSIQEAPAYFPLGYSHISYDDEFNVIEDAYNSFVLEGSDRSFVIKRDSVVQMSDADAWDILLSASSYCFWEDNGILFRLSSSSE